MFVVSDFYSFWFLVECGSVVLMQESGLKVNQPASFAVSLNGAKGVIDAKVHSPSGALEECCVTEIDEGNDGLKVWLCVLHCILAFQNETHWGIAFPHR